MTRLRRLTAREKNSVRLISRDAGGTQCESLIDMNEIILRSAILLIFVLAIPAESAAAAHPDAEESKSVSGGRGRLDSFPRLVLWAWEKPERLSFIRFMKEKLISEVFEGKEFAGMSGGRQIPMAEFLAFLDEDHDMTDWILTFQAGGKAGLDRALKKYEEKASLPWLITVLSEITQDHPRFAAIAERASRVQGDSPAFWTVNFHLARCAVEAGKTDDARSMLDALISVTEKGGVPCPP